MTITPLMVELSYKNVVIVGGGPVAERRIHSLLESGAFLTVVSPKIEDGIRSLWEDGLLDWRQKYFEAKDLDKAFLIIVATNVSEVNQSVIQASPPNCLVSASADASQGNVQFPAHFKQGKLSISISTNGASPLLSVKLKKQFHTTFDKRYGEYVDFLYESRQLIKHSSLSEIKQRQLLKDLLCEEYLNKDKQCKLLDWLKMHSERGDVQ